MQALLELPDQTPPNEINEEILDIFVEEMEEVLNEIITSFHNWKAGPEDTESLKTLQRNFHTIKGSGRLVGAMVIGELGWTFENLLDQIIEGTIPSNGAMSFLIEKVTHLLPNMVEQFKNHQPTPYEARLLISQAHHLTETKGQSLGEFTPPGETATVQPTLIDNIQTAVESLPMLPKIVCKSFEDELMTIFLDEAEEILDYTQLLLKRWQATPHNLPLMKELGRELHTLRGGARMLGISAMGDLSHSLESVLIRMVEGGGTQSNPKLQEVVQNSVDELAAMLGALRSGVSLDMPIELMASIGKIIIEEIVPTPAPTPAPMPASELNDPAELQDPIMQTRMIPFSSISPRLQRLARLLTGACQKQVDFIINGEQIECERTVLDHLVVPLEHILRDAIPGVEDAATRQQAGKPAITKMTLDISKKGTELIIKLSTDN